MSRRRRAGWQTASTHLLLGVLPVLGQLLACRNGGNGRGPTTELISVSVHEGTWLAFDISPDHNHIVFDMLGQLWLMPAAGGQAHAVTDAVRDTAEDGNPAFSPDGKSLAFAGERAGHPGLWRLDIATGRVDRLTTAPDADDEPAWSPDGKTIAFVRQSFEKQDGKLAGGAWLHLLDLASGNVRLLPFQAKGFYSIRDPAWSADGKTIYLVVPKQSFPATVSGGALWSMDLAKGTRALVDSSLEILAPSPSPDGHALAFVAKDSAGGAQVWIRALPGGAPRRLTNEKELTPRRLRWIGSDTLLFVSGGRLRRLAITGSETTEVPFVATVAFPRKVTPLPARHFPAAGSRQPARGQTGLALAPDGSRAAMIALRRLWIIPIPTGAPREVARLPIGARDVDWAPTMDRVVYASGSWGAENLHVLELTTGHDVQLTDLPGREVVPRWSPDGRWIAFIRVAPDSDAHLMVLPVNPDVPDAVEPSLGKDLGEIAAGEWTIGIESATMPTWRLDSRGLLAWRHAHGPVVREPFSILFPSQGEVISLDGKRRKLGNFPFDPTWVRYIDDSTLVYVDADRIMRARVRGDSLLDTPQPVGDDAALYLSASRDGALLYVSAGGLHLRDGSGKVQELGWPVTYTVPTPPPVIITNARIVDGNGNPPTDPRDLLLRNGRIEKIGAPGRLKARDAQVIDAGGGVVMPGLTDMHSHQDGTQQMRGALYNGVTVLRDQGSDIATVAARADEAFSGDVAEPWTSFGGFQLYTDWAFGNGIEQGLEPERDPGQIGRAVDLLLAHGAEHMKIRTFHGWNQVTRLIEAAHRAGLRTTGHCILPLALLAAGMDSKEHLGDTCGERFNAPFHEDITAVFRASRIAVIPTSMLSSWEAIWIADSNYLRRPDVQPFTVAAKLNAKPFGADDPAYWIVEQGQVMLDQMRSLHDAGIPFGVGCDVPLLPWGPHMEMERMVAAGLSPLEAIQAGTLGSMRILGHDAELGSVEVGKIANLIILEPGSEPWRDIRDTRRIREVILGGKVVDRAGLLASGER